MQRIAKTPAKGILILCLPFFVFTFSFTKPYKWESFTATYNTNGYVVLDWTASAEINDPVYTIEHSKDGNSWEVIGKINSTSDLGVIDHQTFVHGNPGPGTHQYRINHLGSNAGKIYSPVRMLNVHDNKEWAFWPSPAHNVLNLQNNQTGEYKPSNISLYDINGKEMLRKQLSTGLNKIDIQNIQPGNYIIYIHSTDGKNFTSVLIKQ